MNWSEALIGGLMARQVFSRKSIVLVPNCNWTGYEADLLVVTNNLRLIDVEVKISRADFKADARKDKWWQSYGKNADTGQYELYNPRIPRQWPVKVWKHYYALPEEIWKPELIEFLPSQSSGVIVLTKHIGNYRDAQPHFKASVVKRAAPQKDAYKLSPEQAIDIARLANLRQWNALDQVESLQRVIESLQNEQEKAA